MIVEWYNFFNWIKFNPIKSLFAHKKKTEMQQVLQM